ncbi:MAG: 3-phosphoshikimate 1-carboxyvinyltransferase, partial [Proteobacteria bacterium]|nr:3-phosphoshikimate 1-carboxyvinyltransferase [Pseudomonadota bacterium]
MTPPMRDYQARPTAQVAGELTVPGDKSISHRSMMLAGICEGTTRVEGFLPSEDCLASRRAMQALGVQVQIPARDTVIVHGVGLRGLKAAGRDLDMGNAGTAMRLFTGLLSGQRFDSRLVGDASLSRRPMERVATPLRLMGARVSTTQGTPPVSIQGVERLVGIEYAMPVASAQVKSALLFAGLFADSPTRVIEPAVSRDHSERMLESLGARIHTGGGRVELEPPSRLHARDLRVPGDFSSAAFFVVAGLIGAAPAG